MVRYDLTLGLKLEYSNPGCEQGPTAEIRRKNGRLRLVENEIGCHLTVTEGI